MSSAVRSPTVGAMLLVVLALLGSVAPFATDLYLAAFPLMVDDLAAEVTSVQLTLTAFLFGLAGGQLVFGPWSDRAGRRIPLLVGSTIFVVASIAAVFAPTVTLLIVARFVQGLSGAAGMVVGRAVIADLARGNAAARAFSLMMIVGGVAPVVAPLLGGVLVESVGWRGLLAVLAMLGVAMLAGAIFVVPESLPPERRRALPLGDSVRVLANRPYLGATATFVFSFATMMAYISASPFVYQEMVGLSPTAYGMMFGINATGLVLASAFSARLLRRRPARAVIPIGLVGLVTASAGLLILALAGAPAVWLPVPLFVSVASLGFVMGPATGVALDAARDAAGLGSAVLGASQFALAAVVSPLVGLGGELTAVPLAIVMLTCALIAVFAHVSLRVGLSSPQSRPEQAHEEAHRSEI